MNAPYDGDRDSAGQMPPSPEQRPAPPDPYPQNTYAYDQYQQTDPAHGRDGPADRPAATPGAQAQPPPQQQYGGQHWQQATYPQMPYGDNPASLYVGMDDLGQTGAMPGLRRLRPPLPRPAARRRRIPAAAGPAGQQAYSSSRRTPAAGLLPAAPAGLPPPAYGYPQAPADGAGPGYAGPGYEQQGYSQPTTYQGDQPYAEQQYAQQPYAEQQQQYVDPRQQYADPRYADPRYADPRPGGPQQPGHGRTAGARRAGAAAGRHRAVPGRRAGRAAARPAAS